MQLGMERSGAASLRPHVAGLLNSVKLLGSFLLMLLFQACQTSQPLSSESRLAAVELKGNTPGQIAEATIEVFRANGYKAFMKNFTNLVFEKKASRMDDIAYGDWMGDEPMWVRVKASILPIGEARFRLQCNAFLVRDKNGSTEEELRVKYRSGPYQKLLNEVARRLGTPTEPGKST
jgi:hypothetical protein